MSKPTHDNQPGSDQLAEAHNRQERYSVLVEHSPYCIHEIDADGRLVSMNPAGLRMMETDDPCDIVGVDYLACVSDEDRPRIAALLESALEGNFAEFEFTAVNGRIFTSNFVPLPERPGTTARLMGITQDITDRRALETQLAQSRQLDALGRLAGGVAHDFNNLLTVILGSAEIMQLREGAESDVELTSILDAATRASDLTSQLLSFARRQITRPKVIDAWSRFEELAPLLRRLLPASVRLEAPAPADAVTVRIDPGQFDQLMLNLVSNARDAMPSGGVVVVRIERADDDSGPRVRIQVGDTGEGIADESLACVFDPFFTTKDSSRGTGLGLALCHGIVSQAGGEIVVDSVEGRGTTFEIRFPFARRREDATAASEPAPAVADRARVLLVEDDELVRGTALRSLRGAGHDVVAAADAEEALEIVAEQDGFDVLLTDLVLPGMDGRRLAEELLRQGRDLEVVYTSGYTDDAVFKSGVQSEDLAFLPKPYTRTALLEAIAGALARRP